MASCDSQPLLSAEAIEAATDRGIRPHRYEHEPRLLSVHVGRNASEPTVIVRRQGLVACMPSLITPDRASSHWPIRLAEHIADIWNDWRAMACFMATDADPGVVNALETLGRRPVMVNLANRASTPRYADRRSEIYVLAALAVIDGGSLPKHRALHIELAAIEYTIREGVLRVADNEAIAARIGCWPSLWETHCLTYAQPIAAGTPGRAIID